MDDSRRYESPEPMDPSGTEPPTGGPAEDRAGTAGDAGWTSSGPTGARGSETGREWVSQLQAMIDELATQAAPVVREIGAKAAELAAIAGEKAGPIAHRAADATAIAGTKMAERSRVFAADLRREAAARRAAEHEARASETAPFEPAAPVDEPAVADDPGRPD